MTRLIRVANNATSTLASGITNSATSVTVAPGDGAKFPSLTGSQYFKATLVKATGEIEVVKVTAKATDTFTIVRANEAVAGASTAYAFSAGDKIECRFTAGTVADELDRLDAAALISVANKTANYTVLAADTSDLIRMDTTAGALTVTLPQISTLTDDFSVKVSKVTSDGNAVSIARSGSDTINGATSYSLTSQWQSAWLIADRSTNTWTAINSSTGSINTVVDTFAGSGTAGPFTLSSDPGSVNNLAVFVGGVYQEKATLTLAGTSLTVGGTVASGTNVQAIFSTPVGIGVPGDGTVTTAKLGALAVTAAKMAAAAIPDKITGATSKTTPVDADELGLVDSADSNTLKKLTWANLKAGVFSAWGALINAATSKTTPVDADAFAIMDSAASNATKKLTWANLLATIKSTFLNASGSAPIYAARAWVNFNGTGTVAIRASGNVSSITDNGTGDYTVNFTTAMPDADYSLQGTLGPSGVGTNNYLIRGYQNGAPNTASAARIECFNATASRADAEAIHVAVFR